MSHRLSRQAFGAAVGLASALALAAPAKAQAIAPIRPKLPRLSGPHQVGTTALHLVDPQRTDPWWPKRQRELMVTVSYPAFAGESYPRAPWLSGGVLAATAAALPPGANLKSVRRHAGLLAPAEWRGCPRPVVLFSPGFGFSRELSSVLTDDLASRGYVVVAMDHTYEAPAVDFPDGRVELAVELDPLDDKALSTALEVRVADTRFVLDQLEWLNAGHNPDSAQRRLPWGLVGSLDLARVGMVGHSYGGYTAAEAMRGDRRVLAGVAMGGLPEHSGPARRRGLDRPFLLLGTTSGDPSGTGFLAKHRGWKRNLRLVDGAAGSYTDYQAVLPQFGAAAPAKATQELIGTANAARSVLVQRELLGGFFDLHLRGADRGLFAETSPRFPEFTLVP